MRNLRKNLEPVFYRLYEGQEEILDEFENSTGTYIPIYSELKSAMLCISPNKGTSEVNMFGSFADYDRTMTTSDTSCKIDESAVLWIDGADTNGAWNYIVKTVAPWKNSISFAIKEVSVSVYTEYQEMSEKKEQLLAKGYRSRRVK